MARKASDLKGHIDFGIITIRHDECSAVLDRFSSQEEAVGRRHYDIGTIADRRGEQYNYAVIKCIGAGEGIAQSVAHDLILDLDPAWLFLIGICGAAPSMDFTLGDVVCATRVTDFSVRAAQEGKPDTFAGAGGPMHRRVENLLNRLPAIERTLVEWNTPESITLPKPSIDLTSIGHNVYGDKRWQKKVVDSLRRHFPPDAPVRLPICTTHPVVSANVLAKSPTLFAQWLQTARDTGAVEMELAGVYLAASDGDRQYPILAIRGISDIVGLRRDEAWTKYACHTAAAFARALVYSGEFSLFRAAPPKDGGGRVRIPIAELPSDTPPANPTALFQDVEEALFNQRYEQCRDALTRLLEMSPTAGKALWLAHLLYFELTCAANRNDRPAFVKQCMEYYGKAIDVDAALRLFPDDKYVVSAPIGFGGFSYVYKVLAKDDTPFAAKSIRDEFVANTSMAGAFLKKLETIRAMTRQAHDERSLGVARIEDWHFSNRRIVIVYEYVAGESLAQRLRRMKSQSPGTLATREHYIASLALLARLCDTLSFAHQNNVLHLDLSPSNVLLVGGDSNTLAHEALKLVDFDMARLAVGPGGASLTSFHVAGTARYVDPRVIRDPETANTTSDLYSVAKLAKALLSGDPDGRNPSELSREASPIIDELINTALMENTSERLQSASDMRKCFRYLTDLAEGKAWGSLDSRMWGVVFVVVALYVGSLFVFPPCEFGTSLFVIVSPVLGMLLGVRLLFVATKFAIIAVDHILHDRLQYGFSIALLLIWLIGIVIVRVQPQYYYLVFGCALLLTGARLQLYKLSLGNALLAWQKIKTGSLIDLLCAVFCFIGFLTVQVMSDEMAKVIPVTFNAVVPIFSFLYIPAFRRDWEIVCASVARSRRWKNIIDYAHENDERT